VAIEDNVIAPDIIEALVFICYHLSAGSEFGGVASEGIRREKLSSQFGPSTANDSEPETVNAVQVKFDAREIDGNQIRSTDIKLLWMGDGPVPDTNKYIRDQDRRLQIVNYATVHVGKVLALYEVQARG